MTAAGDDKRLQGSSGEVSAAMAAPVAAAQEDENTARREFFASGVESWLPILGDLTFPSVSLTLSCEAACALAGAASGYSAGDELARAIDAALAERKWAQAFVKLSTRAPKDAPQILEKAAITFAQQGGALLPANERCALFSTLVQQNFCISSGLEAVELLAASERIREDCAWATAAADFDELGLHIVLRRWDGAMPPSREFRGIVWKGKMHAISQYYHALHFPELQELRSLIADELVAVHTSLQANLHTAGFDNCIIDFAWLGKGDIKVIELNPFDGVGLGTMAASTCLFRWDDPDDRHIITEGPFELRLRESPQTEYELKTKMNPDWRQIIFPPRWRVASATEKTTDEKAAAKGYAGEVGKGRGKGKQKPATFSNSGQES